MKNLDLKNFDIFYENELEPKLIELEKERKKVFIISQILLIINTILGITAFISFILCFIFEFNNIHAGLCFSVCITSFFLLFALITVRGIFTYKYSQKFKNNFYKNLFTLLGYEYENTSAPIVVINSQKYVDLIKEICKSSGCFANCNSFLTDDVITGEYKTLPFKAIETDIETSIGKNGTLVFKGTIFITKINKKINNNILINSDFYKENEMNQNLVKLESAEFDKEFEVYSDDQIEARYVLTPSFMQRLINYKKQHNSNDLKIFIGKNLPQEYNVVFYISSFKDNFELPLNKTLLNKESFYIMLKDLADALDIISELKLEQNIGL